MKLINLLLIGAALTLASCTNTITMGVGNEVTCANAEETACLDSKTREPHLSL